MNPNSSYDQNLMTAPNAPATSKSGSDQEALSLAFAFDTVTSQAIKDNSINQQKAEELSNNLLQNKSMMVPQFDHTESNSISKAIHSAPIKPPTIPTPASDKGELKTSRNAPSAADLEQPLISTISEVLSIDDLEASADEPEYAKARGPHTKSLTTSEDDDDFEENETEIPAIDASLDLRPQCLEIRAHLTNLTGKNVAQRAEWLQIDTVKFQGRLFEVKQLLRQIKIHQNQREKFFVAVSAEPGFGKTAFMAELYGELTHSPHDVVTIAPAQSKSKRPFASIRNLIAQRLYVTGNEPNEIFEQLGGAIYSMIESKSTAQTVLTQIKDLWLQSKKPRDAEDERATQDRIAPYVDALRTLFHADLEKNALVWLFDDVDAYDPESLAILAHTFENLGDVPLTLVVTHDSATPLPTVFQALEVYNLELPTLSDEDLTLLTQNILEQMSQSREKLIVPPELCRIVAQHACGSPKRALETMVKDFSPEKMLLWNENLEALKREEVSPERLQNLKKRFVALPMRNRAVLGIASILNAPFTAHTIDAVTYDPSNPTRVENAPYLKQLLKLGFLTTSQTAVLENTTTFTFKHEYERLAISSIVTQEVREKVFGNAAQWYALNNPDGRFNETIGNLWHEQHNDTEASHYFERVAYAAMTNAKYPQARRMFKKLLETLPSDNVARRIQAALDASRVTLRLGNVSEALRLARSTWKHALKISAFSMAAAAALQIAEILMLMGRYKHVMAYVKKARRMLNISMIPQIMLKTYTLEIRYLLAKFQFKRAKQCLAHATTFADKTGIEPTHCLELRRCKADWMAAVGSPNEAVESYKAIIHDAEVSHDQTLYAETYQALGTLQFRICDRGSALDAWNIALGHAQEMNDVFLHASLLCDIAEGAIELKAIRTARATNEQALSIAQQLGHKRYLTQCLINNAEIYYRTQHYAKAERTLRKAASLAAKAGQIQLILRILKLQACCYAADFEAPTTEDSNAAHLYAPRVADKLFQKIEKLYEKYHLKLDIALLQPLYAEYFLTTKQNIQALNAYRRARQIYADLLVNNAKQNIDVIMDQLYRDTDIAQQNEHPTNVD